MLVGVLALFAWSPWASGDRQRELAWLEAYAAWLARAESGAFDPADCRTRFDTGVGEIPTGRFESMAQVARQACSSFPDPPDWQQVGWSASSQIVDWHSFNAQPAEEPRLGDVAAEIAGTTTRAYCWRKEEWEPLVEEWRIIDRDEFWVVGFADTVASEIHLAPEVCEPLRLFYGGDYSPELSEETLRLADALRILAHEAEHIRVPEASEAEVECYGLQRVRGLAEDAGRPASYAEELAGLAHDISYPAMPPDYQTEKCKPGGPLDLRPNDSAWP